MEEDMNRNLKKSIISLFAILSFCIFNSSSVTGQISYLNSIKKIDIHTHIVSDASYLKDVMEELNMKFFTICTRGTDMDRINFQVNAAKEFCNQYPRYYAWSTTFDLTHRNDTDWINQVKRYLKDSFDNGAVAVKVWKDIGMQIKNPNGEYIQIDDSMFNPIFDYIEQEGKTLFAHMGEPIQAWMPLPIGADGKPRSYWANNPEWHFWDKPDKPSYNEIIAARDHVLAKHPNLRVVACHLGSLEFDVDEVAKRFDKYPNFVVDTAARIGNLMSQERGKVRAFLIKYQDRILYGTDMFGGMITSSGAKRTPEQAERAKQSLSRRYSNDFEFFATDNEISRRDYSIRGLALPKEVLYKIFYGNAVRWVPGINKDF